MAFELKDGQGSLFKNDRKVKETQPDYTGKILIGGVTYRLSAWIKEGKRGKFMSLSAQTHQDEAPAKPLDVMAICESCGREIVLQRHTVAETYSEFMSGDGRCYGCTFTKSKAATRLRAAVVRFGGAGSCRYAIGSPPPFSLARATTAASVQKQIMQACRQ